MWNIIFKKLLNKIKNNVDQTNLMEGVLLLKVKNI